MVPDSYEDEVIELLVALRADVGPYVWGAPHRRMEMPAARDGSHEQLLHEVLDEPSVLVVPDETSPGWLTRRRPHHAIGVVYRPGADRAGNWVPTMLGERYDAFLSFDETTALFPLNEHDAADRPELQTYPWLT